MPPPTIAAGEHYVFGLTIWPSVRPAVVPQHHDLLRVTRYLGTKWRDFNDTCHKWSSCEWHCRKGFRGHMGQRSRSQSDGHGNLVNSITREPRKACEVVNNN